MLQYVAQTLCLSLRAGSVSVSLVTTACVTTSVHVINKNNGNTGCVDINPGITGSVDIDPGITGSVDKNPGITGPCEY